MNVEHNLNNGDETSKERRLFPCKEQPSHFTVQLVNMTIKRLGYNTQIIQTDNDLNILTLGKTGISPLGFAAQRVRSYDQGAPKHKRRSN